MSSAREDILNTIGKYTARAETREADYRAIPRDYQQIGVLDASERIAMFVERLNDYGCAVYRGASTEIRQIIGSVLAGRGKNRLLASPALPVSWLPENQQFDRRPDLSYQEMDLNEGVITGCRVAVAATGTIMISHSTEEGSRALTLIPDYHLCVVFENQIVETVVEAIRSLDSLATFPLTTISGPSATADIEMTRIKGVHGPRTLDVLVVAE